MSSTLRSLARLMHGSRLRYGLAIASLVVASVFLYLAPLVPLAALDGILDSQTEPSPISTWLLHQMGGLASPRDLWIPALVLVGLTAVAGGFTYLREFLASTATERIVADLRDRIYDRLQRLPMRFHDDAESGDLVQRATSDVDTVHVFLGTQVVEFGRILVLLVVPLPIMAAVDVRLTVASLVLIPVILGFSVLFFGRVRRAYLASDEAEATLTANVQENIAGARVVRAFARQDHERERFASRNAEYRAQDYRVYVLAGWYWGVSDFLCFAQQAIVVVAGVALLVDGQMTVGSLFFFLTAVSMFVFPMRQLGRIVADLGKATVSIGRIEAILHADPESDPRRPVRAQGRGAVVFEDVSFAYNEGEPVLRNVSMRVSEGETLAIVGPPGSGKSTLIALLLRLYEPDAGRITLDGHDVRTLSRADLRTRVGVVQQEPFLFSKTLRENLSMGRPGASASELRMATEQASVHDAIEAFEHGFETKVGERGVTLSGGQRQRVAIARTLLQAPDVLVLDDALSAVDTRTEAQILAALHTRVGRKTTIVIAHRMSTVRMADRVAVLDRGRVVQMGAVEELASIPGPFAAIARSYAESAREETSNVDGL